MSSSGKSVKARRARRHPEAATQRGRRARAGSRPASLRTSGAAKSSIASGRPWRRRLIVVLVIALPVVIVAGAGGFGLVVWERIDRVHLMSPGSPPGGRTYLLIGSDSRAFARSRSDRARFGSASRVSGERADVMLLVRIVRGGRVRVLEVPRDLVVQFPDGTPVRMTLTLLRGPQTVVDTVCHSLGIGIDHVVLIHFDGLRRLVDTVGGVSVRVPVPERDLVTGLALQHAGLNRLDGQQALAYVRSRQLERFEGATWRPEAPSAEARSNRARDVLTQLGSRLRLSPMAPVATIRGLWALSGAITVDDHANPLVLRDLARSLARLDTTHGEHLPVTFHPGDVPTADLQTNAPATLASFQGGPQPGCSLRMMHPTSPLSASITLPGGTP